ncbi:unnamed protein product [Cochlearia groenlandica]
MSCSVAICNSSLFCNKPSLLSSPSSPSSSSSSAGASPSPKSPFRLRFQKPLTGFAPPPICIGSDYINGQSPPEGALKRKRPTKLYIPIGTAGLVSPAAEIATATPRDERREVESEGDGYSVYCKRGRREAMEDRFSAITNLHGDHKQAIFGVYDGHGGVKAAEFASKNLDKNVLEEVFDKGNESSDMENAVKRGYLTTDAAFLRDKNVKGGSCCVTALIKEGNLVVANAGDCRAVMSQGGVAQALSSDHRPSRDDERKRIETTGGYVDTFHGVWRIQGSLAVSRGIGDSHLKKWVIAEPETKMLRIKHDHEFLILASDGLWDKVSNQEAVDIARPFCVGTTEEDKEVESSLLVACKKLADLSASRGSSDDISVMLIPLHKFI